MINKFFKIISGKPKSGNISECLSPIMATIQMALVGYLFGLASCADSFFLKFLYFTVSTFTMWQIGWGMSSKRFILYESRLEEEQTGKVMEVIRPYVFITQLMICIIIDLIAISISVDIVRYIMFIISIFLAWQSGWGMNIVRTNNNESEIGRKNEI